MRPVNLIPPEERRGDAAPTRTGALSYVVIGLLGLILAGVTGVVLSNESVKNKQVEVAALEQEASEAEARAQSLASFTQFEALKEARVDTIAQLATSRFDWERVMRELAKVIPEHVWLVNLTGKASPEVKVPEEANIALRSAIPGYALELVGCARSQRDVAALISSIHDIDGVTRVTAPLSEKPKDEVAQTGESDQVRDDCRTRNFVTQFELVAAFDSPSPPLGAGGGGTLPPAGGGTAPAPAPEPAPEGGESDGGAGEVQQTRAEGSNEVAEAKGDAEQAANVVPGGGG